MEYTRYRISKGRLYEVHRINEDEQTTSVRNDGSGNMGSALNKSYNSATPQQREGSFTVDSNDFDNDTSNNPTEVNINAKNPNDAKQQISQTRSRLGNRNIRYNVRYGN